MTPSSLLSARALWAAAGILLLVLGLFVWHLRSNAAAPAKEEAEIPSAASSGVVLTPQQAQTAGVSVMAVFPQPLARVLRAPGEIQTNAYRASIVASRISATIIARQARLGERVRKGQRLVTLFSAEMAEAQGAFVLAENDFQRMQRLGVQNVSGLEIEQATIKRQQARGRLESFGSSAAEIIALAGKGLPAGRAGQFELYAPEGGKITLDAFRAGEVAEPGKVLFEISDPSLLWVEAHLGPAEAAAVAGESAEVFANGQRLTARIVQVGDHLDTATRTIAIRLEIDNPGERLKPGQFVDVELHGAAVNVLSVPDDAVLNRPDGSHILCVETAPNRFALAPVDILFTSGGRTAIAGIAPSTRVAVKGAFFIVSEADKASFGEDE